MSVIVVSRLRIVRPEDTSKENETLRGGGLIIERMSLDACGGESWRAISPFGDRSRDEWDKALREIVAGLLEMQAKLTVAFEKAAPKTQAWDETAPNFAECPDGSPCSDLSGRERDCLDVGYCRGASDQAERAAEEAAKDAAFCVRNGICPRCCIDPCACEVEINDVTVVEG